MLPSSISMTRSLVLALCKSRQLAKKLGSSINCWGDDYRPFHTSQLLTYSVQNTIIRQGGHKKGRVIEIWHGMTPREIAEATGLTNDQVREAMDICNLKWIYTLDDVRNLLSKLQFRFTVIANPNTITLEEEVNIKSMIEAKRVPTGKMFQVKPPVVTIMGHVDHGKTTLLDSLRHSEIVKGEFGGITQHIGAFVVSLEENVSRAQLDQQKLKKLVTFLDTPGHAAFSAMRQRGADATDIVVLVVAADDGVMEQTIESIKYARAAKKPMIIAVNKIDKAVNLTDSLKRIKTSLYAEGILLEEDGGETQLVKISALKGEGLQEMKEAILALSETLELKAPYDGGVVGSVIESKVDPLRGKMATILVESGTLKKQQYLIAGETSYCRVRAMFDERTLNIDSASPGFPVQIIGWKEDDLPEAGDRVYQFPDEKAVKEIIKEVNQLRQKEKAFRDAAEAAKRETEHRDQYVEKRAKAKAEKIPFWQLKYKGPKTKTYVDDPDEPFKVRVCVKADVHGSAEVLLDIIDSYPNESQLVKLDLLHYGVGPVTEGDIELAACFNNSIIYAFNIPLTPKILSLAKEKNVKIKTYNVIYHLVDDLKKEISAKIPEKDEEVIIGEAVVQRQFTFEEKRKVVPIAGCRCSKGPIFRDDCWYKVVRGDQTVATGLELASMKHLKEDVKSIAVNIECGLRFKNLPENFNFIPSDRLICYKIKKVKPVTKWKPPGF